MVRVVVEEVVAVEKVVAVERVVVVGLGSGVVGLVVKGSAMEAVGL